jgi:hypothetical protein
MLKRLISVFFDFRLLLTSGVYVVYNTVMKNNSKLTNTLKLLASHSLVAAVVTQPYVVSVFSDLLNISTSGGEHGAANIDHLLGSLSIFSGAALVIAIVAFVGYLLRKKK